MTTGSIDVRFGDPAATAPTWDEVERLLGAAELYWLTTVRADGRPHVTPLVAVTTGTNGWQAGTDVVVEGRADRVTGRDRLLPLAGAWLTKYGDDWAWDADDEGFTAGDGSGPWVYVVPPSKVIAFGKDPHSQTTYRPA